MTIATTTTTATTTARTNTDATDTIIARTSLRQLCRKEGLSYKQAVKACKRWCASDGQEFPRELLPDGFVLMSWV